MTGLEKPGESFDQALDRALARALRPPQVSEAFHRRLQSGLAEAAAVDLSLLRAQLEDERRHRLAQLDARYLRIKRETLGTMLGGAFASGAGIAVAMPWLQSHFGSVAPLVLAFAGAAVGLAIGLGLMAHSVRGDLRPVE